jgi:hypothetical protein
LREPADGNVIDARHLAARHSALRLEQSHLTEEARFISPGVFCMDKWGMTQDRTTEQVRPGHPIGTPGGTRSGLGEPSEWESGPNLLAQQRSGTALTILEMGQERSPELLQLQATSTDQEDHRRLCCRLSAPGTWEDTSPDMAMNPDQAGFRPRESPVGAFLGSACHSF